jgi:hypothetical protein
MVNSRKSGWGKHFQQRVDCAGVWPAFDILRRRCESINGKCARNASLEQSMPGLWKEVRMQQAMLIDNDNTKLPTGLR